MWKCPNCETINKEDVCVVCGERNGRTEKKNYVSVQQTQTFEQGTAAVTPRVVKKKVGAGKKFEVILLCIIIIGIIGCGVFLVMKNYDEGKKEVLDNELKTAQQLLEDKRVEECLEFLQNIKGEYSIYDSSFDAHYIEGYAYMELEQYNDAILCFEKALELENSAECCTNLAVCYARVKKISRAESIISKNKSGDEVSRYVKAEIATARGEVDDAINGFEYVIDNTGNDFLKKRAYIALAEIYKEQRHKDKDNFYFLEKQIEVMEEAMRELKLEDDLTLTEMMGEAYFTSQQYDLSVAKFKRLLELGYDRDYIYKNIAIIYQQTDQLEEAEAVLFEMNEKFPKNYECYAQLAFVYAGMESKKPVDERDYTRVLECYEMAEKYAGSQNKSDLAQLERLISALREKEWIE